MEDYTSENTPLLVEEWRGGGEESTPLHGDFRGLSEANFIFTAAHAYRRLFKARKESYQALGVLSDQLRALSGQRRIFYDMLMAH